MTRVAIFALSVLLAFSADALAQITPVETQPASIAPDDAPSDVPARLAIAEPGLRIAAQAGAPVVLPRRRGSMVGYIDEAVVSSKIRVRFDTGLHSEAPDRAEFFYAKCGCYRDLNVNDPAYDPDAPGPGPGIISDLNFQQFYVLGEYAATDRFSAFAELPMRWLQPQTANVFPDQSGVSDLRAGVKLAIANSDEVVLTAQVKTFLTTGDSRLGLGTGHASVEPGILYHQQFSERGSIESQFALWIPFGGSKGVPTSVDEKFAGSILTYGIGPSFDVYSSERVRFAPVVELVGWRVLGGFQTSVPADASGINIVNLKLGARASWSNGSSFYGGYGRALTETDWYDEIFRFEYRFSF